MRSVGYENTQDNQKTCEILKISSILELRGDGQLIMATLDSFGFSLSGISIYDDDDDFG